MPKQKRHKTQYPGVYYIVGESAITGRKEKIYYIRYPNLKGKTIEEKAGRQHRNRMTPAKASYLRAEKINGKEPSNNEKRSNSENKWTIEKLWQHYKENKHKLKGMVTDENRFQNHILPIFGKKEPSEISPIDIDLFRIKLLKNRKEGTVKNILELLRRIINYGAKKHLYPQLNFTIELPKPNNKKTEDLNPDQLRSLWSAIGEDSNIQAANLMKMALFTGMRRSELFNLKWLDVKFEHGFIYIRDPKGGQDQKIPLNDMARKLLGEHLRTDSPYVFPGRGGRKRVDINKQVNRIKKRAGLPKDFRPLHGLRHVYASMIASSGRVDMFQLQKLLTHKSPEMTQRYAHLRDEALKRASVAVSEVLQHAINED
jgi:integrase